MIDENLYIKPFNLEDPSKKKYDQEIKYTVCSLTDLQGFSSHLELGSDLRTNIGKGAIDRLKNLDKAIEYINNEKNELPEFYPQEKFYLHRINDSLIILMDIDDFFYPSISEIGFHGHSANDIGYLFKDELSQNISEKKFIKKYKRKADLIIEELSKYLGLVARTHCYINNVEKEEYFPGAKTIISTGYRRMYKKPDGEDDYLSANFAFSNAYVAGKHLHGAKLFVDSNLLRILSQNIFSHNIIKLSSVMIKSSFYSPLMEFDYENIRPKSVSERDEVKPENVTIFRKSYYFYPLNSMDLSFLQIIHKLAIDFNMRKKEGEIKDNFMSKIVRNLINSFDRTALLDGGGVFILGLSDISKKISGDYNALLK